METVKLMWAATWETCSTWYVHQRVFRLTVHTGQPAWKRNDLCFRWAHMQYLLSVFFLFVLLYYLEPRQVIRERFRASNTALSHPRPSSFPADHSKAVPQLQFFFICQSNCGFICGVCFVLSCSSSLLLLVPWKDCASWLWKFLGTLKYFCRECCAPGERFQLPLDALPSNNQLPGAGERAKPSSTRSKSRPIWCPS